ncbi:Hypothetical_protein [Hexamita inflata]|uniref:Hypothetical_protein n=1 Tax=Hexamita inflata TaxID=28002 RepID=A0AA86PHR6_9EUKA|nr:Hypothetical protein HINF_LOCUS23737 [Hexamita inflata]
MLFLQLDLYNWLYILVYIQNRQELMQMNMLQHIAQNCCLWYWLQIILDTMLNKLKLQKQENMYRKSSELSKDQMLNTVQRQYKTIDIFLYCCQLHLIRRICKKPDNQNEHLQPEHMHQMSIQLHKPQFDSIELQAGILKCIIQSYYLLHSKQTYFDKKPDMTSQVLNTLRQSIQLHTFLILQMVQQADKYIRMYHFQQQDRWQGINYNTLQNLKYQYSTYHNQGCLHFPYCGVRANFDFNKCLCNNCA